MTAGEEKYLGDGVYVRRDRFGMLTLVTKTGDACKHVIHMEPEVYRALVAYVKALDGPTEVES